MFQVRILEWVAMPFSRASSWPKDRSCVSYICLLVGGFLITSAILGSLCESRSAEITQREVNRVNSEKVKVAQLYPTLCDPTDYTVHGILQGRIPEWVAFPFSRASSHPGIKPRSPKLQADSSPAEPQGKPKYTGVGSLSLLQQTSSPRSRILYCRMILSNWANSLTAK